ncbi:MAG: hypothetical protein JWP38_1364 [Herbaspirillum sp.]|nr:hypothetical protein [Herbaspirillum sp.]
MPIGPVVTNLVLKHTDPSKKTGNKNSVYGKLLLWAGNAAVELTTVHAMPRYTTVCSKKDDDYKQQQDKVMEENAKRLEADRIAQKEEADKKRSDEAEKTRLALQEAIAQKRQRAAERRAENEVLRIERNNPR